MALTLGMLEQATGALYRGAGEPVTFRPVQGTPKPIDALIDRSAQLFARDIGLDFSDSQVTARIRKLDVPHVLRGDQLVDAAGATYEVENVNSAFNEAEHELELRPRD